MDDEKQSQNVGIATTLKSSVESPLSNKFHGKKLMQPLCFYVFDSMSSMRQRAADAKFHQKTVFSPMEARLNPRHLSINAWAVLVPIPLVLGLFAKLKQG
jgi:hypothetical protein